MSTPHDELPPDPQLRAALRHAPDRDLEPPAEVSTRILKAAHAAVAPTRPAPTSGRAWLAALWQALRRPAGGAAFAGLMLASLIGLMWRDGPPPVGRPADDGPAPQAAVEASPRPAASAAPTAVPAPPAPPPASPPQPEEARRAARPAAPPLMPPPAARQDAAPASEQSKSQAAGPPGPAAPRTDAADQAAAPSARLERSRAGATAKLGAAAQAEGSGRPADDPLAGVAEALLPLRPAAAEAVAPTAADGSAAPGSAAGWLADLRLSSQGRWQRVEEALPAEAIEVLAADGRPLGRLALGEAIVLWQPAGPDAPRWRATLAPDAAARLRAGLAAWAAAPPR